MNKRIRNKQLKTSNLRRQNDILNKISKHFTIKNKQFGNGYFIFTMGDNAVCHFNIKETPGWKYGIWLSDREFQLFGEHEELIDKFKPSATYINYKNDIKKFINIISKIKNDPKLYFVDSLTYGEALEPWKEHKYEDGEVYYSGYKCIRKYNEETQCYDIFIRDETITQEDFVNKKWNEYWSEKKQEKKNIEHDRQYAFNFFKELPNIYGEIVAVGVIDLNKGNWICSPRYDIRIVLDKNIDEYKFDSLYNKLDDLIKRKSYSDEVLTSEHRFDLCACYGNLNDIKECDYKYYKKLKKI